MVTVAVIVIVAIVFLLILWRLYVLRRINRSRGLFPSIENSGPRSWERPYGSSYQPYRAPVALWMDDAYSPSRQVRAADTDAGGRRLGSIGVSDSDRKDELPAYDKFGGPPRYPQSSSLQGPCVLPQHTTTEGGADNSLTRDGNILKSPPPAYLDPRS
ncbi:hypothetical protein EDD15DRAFT_972334 [Pisolithus albus]|nr:hypothetical protein EDD15DRAFT_972334 [Pisolithus albus]